MRFLLVRCRPGALAENAPEIPVALARLATDPLAPAFPVAWTQRRPTGQMTGIPEYAHVCANLGQYGPGGDAIYTRDRVQPRNHVLIAGDSLLDFGRQFCQLLLESSHLLQQVPQQPPPVRGEGTLPCQLQLSFLASERARGIIGHPARVSL